MSLIEKKRILVVDDNPNNLSLVTSLISPYYEVLLANNGEKAVAIANEEKPDLILLDIMMPDISGFEVCIRLKSSDNTNLIPVIFLTAKVSGADFEKGFEVGAVDYVTKPINAKELLARVHTHLLLNEQKDKLQSHNDEIIALNNSLEIEIHKRTGKLKEAIIQLEQQNKDLEQTSYIISHNLRGPVANLVGLNSIFNRSNLSDPHNGDVFDHFSIATKDLDEVVKDLSAIITIRNSSPILEMVSLEDIVNATLLHLKKDINSSNAIIDVDVSLAPNMLGEPAYLESICCNLISNAIKYRSQSPLHISITSKQDNKVISIIFKDNGIGIEEKDFKKIFEPFKKMSMEPGKGLGLYLVKNQVESLNGKVSVASTLGQGATFTLTFKNE